MSDLRERIAEIVGDFWGRVDKSGDCWLWISRTNRSGRAILIFPEVKP